MSHTYNIGDIAYALRIKFLRTDGRTRPLWDYDSDLLECKVLKLTCIDDAFTGHNQFGRFEDTDGLVWNSDSQYVGASFSLSDQSFTALQQNGTITNDTVRDYISLQNPLLVLNELCQIRYRAKRTMEYHSENLSEEALRYVLDMCPTDKIMTRTAASSMYMQLNDVMRQIGDEVREVSHMLVSEGTFIRPSKTVLLPKEVIVSCPVHQLTEPCTPLTEECQATVVWYAISDKLGYDVYFTDDFVEDVVITKILPANTECRIEGKTIIRDEYNYLEKELHVTVNPGMKDEKKYVFVR